MIQAPSRPAIRYSFTVPARSRSWPSDPEKVVMQPITVAEQTRAAEIAGGIGLRFAYESMKASIVEANGTPVTWEDGGKEKFLEGCSPAVRELLLAAYHKIHNPPDRDSEDFLASMTTEV